MWLQRAKSDWCFCVHNGWSVSFLGASSEGEPTFAFVLSCYLSLLADIYAGCPNKKDVQFLAENQKNKINVCVIIVMHIRRTSANQISIDLSIAATMNTLFVMSDTYFWRKDASDHKTLFLWFTVYKLLTFAMRCRKTSQDWKPVCQKNLIFTRLNYFNKKDQRAQFSRLFWCNF